MKIEWRTSRLESRSVAHMRGEHSVADVSRDHELPSESDARLEMSVVSDCQNHWSASRSVRACEARCDGIRVTSSEQARRRPSAVTRRAERTSRRDE
jgi:hypothetical protein